MLLFGAMCAHFSDNISISQFRHIPPFVPFHFRSTAQMAPAFGFHNCAPRTLVLSRFLRAPGPPQGLGCEPAVRTPARPRRTLGTAPGAGSDRPMAMAVIPLALRPNTLACQSHRAPWSSGCSRGQAVAPAPLLNWLTSYRDRYRHMRGRLYYAKR